MPTFISPLSHIEKGAQLGENVHVGPFCHIGADVKIGDHCTLDSHVALVGHTKIGSHNRFWPNCVIGAEPQDYSYEEGAPTQVVIGDHNQFREGVTVSRGAEKEDGVTRIGNHNLLMANSHVAHNCCLYDRVILVNGVLLGGHVHVHDRAIISGNSVVHHFASIGTLAFVSGGGRVPTDVLPFMMAAGSDEFKVRTINIVGMRRAGISEDAIKAVREAYKLIFREHKAIAAVRSHFEEQLETFPIELATLLNAWQAQKEGKMGRAREVYRDQPYQAAKAA